MTRLIVLIAIPLSVIACHNNPPVSRMAHRRVPSPLILVFADLTSSLTAEEVNSAGAALTDLYARAPEGAEIKV